MRQDERDLFDKALRQARETAYEPGEYVEQESFTGAGEIRPLAERAAVAPDVSVLDLCCGVGGPGRFITRELRCDYVGMDSSASAVRIAPERAGDLLCRFGVGHVPPLRPVADSLTAAFAADAAEITSAIGPRGLDELLAARRLWSGWLATGRVRKIALVVERQ